MPHVIHNWTDISNQFSGSILLGNGASIGINNSFTYQSLRKHAIDNGLLNTNVQRLFDYFKTDDFELILRLVWQANNVNIALEIPDSATKLAYEHVRDCLIQAVRSIHSEYHEVESQFPHIAKFLSSFRTVLSLNYDLTLYWIIMHSNRTYNGHSFKDCIIHGEFDDNWKRFRESINAWDKSNTLVFYPHGSLVLARNILGKEIKLDTQEDSDLLCSILRLWESGDYVPLFVSEGTSTQKISAIHNSHYLNTVYREILSTVGSSLTIYGWGFGEHDTHILNRMSKSVVSKVAISVFNQDQAYCNRAYQMICDYLGYEIDIRFFDCLGPSCWNQPA